MDRVKQYLLKCQTCNLRENLINWLSIEKRTKILYISCDAGALVSYLCALECEVDILEDDEEAISEIQKNCGECGKYKIISESVCKYDAFNRYDYVLAIDCWKKYPHYTLTEVIGKFNSYVNRKGKMFLVFNNSLGLRYFNGVYPDGKKLFTSLQDEKYAKYWNKHDIEDVLIGLGINKYKFYYPFPDYIFPRTIFTDEIMEYMSYGHHYNIVGYDRLKFFDELNISGQLQRNGCIDKFANSFLVEICEEGNLDNCIYAKNQYYSRKEHRFFTRILRNNKKAWGEKVPITQEASLFLRDSYQKSIKLKDTAHFEYIKYHLEEDGKLTMPFIEERALSTELYFILYDCLHNISIRKEEVLAAVVSVFNELYQAMQSDAVWVEEESIFTSEFREFFGEERIEGDFLCLNPSTLDLHCDHIYRCKRGKYQVIDTIPIVFFNVPVKYQIWSVVESWLYTYVKNNKVAEELLSTKLICEALGISEEEMKTFAGWKGFQFVNSGEQSQILDLYGKVYRPVFLEYSQISDFGELIDSADRRTSMMKKNKGNVFSLKKQTPIIIYGAAAIGFALKNILEFYGFNVVGYMDKRYEEIPFAHGLPVWSVKDAPTTEDTVVIVGIKNVFVHEKIAKELIKNGFTNLLYKSKRMIEGVEERVEYVELDKFYDYLIELKGKNLEEYIFPEMKTFPKTSAIDEFQLIDKAIGREEHDYFLVNMPIMNVFTAQRELNPQYIWAEQSIVSLIPHTKLYSYLWEGGEDKTDLYIDFCSLGAHGSNVDITPGWKKNLISSRLSVLASMKAAFEQDGDFFYRNAPEVIINREDNYFNLNGGRHRAALFVYNNCYTMPVKVRKEEYAYFINEPVVQELNSYLSSRCNLSFNNPSFLHANSS